MASVAVDYLVLSDKAWKRQSEVANNSSGGALADPSECPLLTDGKIWSVSAMFAILLTGWQTKDVDTD